MACLLRDSEQWCKLRALRARATGCCQQAHLVSEVQVLEALGGILGVVPVHLQASDATRQPESAPADMVQTELEQSSQVQSLDLVTVLRRQATYLVHHTQPLPHSTVQYCVVSMARPPRTLPSAAR